MKKNKKHIIRILIIITMTLLTIGTSDSVSTELKIINNSSSHLKIIVFDRDGEENNEKFELDVGQYYTIIYSGVNNPRHPLDYIKKITLQDRDNVLIKGFRQALGRSVNGTWVEVVEPGTEDYIILENNNFQLTEEQVKPRRIDYYLWEIIDESIK